MMTEWTLIALECTTFLRNDRRYLLTMKSYNDIDHNKTSACEVLSRTWQNIEVVTDYNGLLTCNNELMLHMSKYVSKQTS